jgi:catalase
VVHARGAGAYGYFQPYASMADVTAADFLRDPRRRGTSTGSTTGSPCGWRTAWGSPPPGRETRPNHGRSSPALSQAGTRSAMITSRRIAVLAADGVDAVQVRVLTQGLAGSGAVPEVVGLRDSALRAADGRPLEVARALLTVSSVLYDAVVVPGGHPSVAALCAEGDAVHAVAEAFRHGKAVGGLGDGVRLLAEARLAGVRLAGPGDGLVAGRGVVTLADPGPALWDEFARALAEAVARHRHWDRDTVPVPA